MLRPALTASAAGAVAAHFGEAIGVDPGWASLTPWVDVGDAMGRVRGGTGCRLQGQPVYQPCLAAAPLPVATRAGSKVWPKAVVDRPAAARLSHDLPTGQGVSLQNVTRR
jgi:hypothetical protein